jgi:NAD(P)H-hydrate epimerase
MKLFKTKQVRAIDQYTIDHEPISHIDLMERAASALEKFLIGHESAHGKIMIFCGPGNNGGDGLALARLLACYENRFKISVFVLDTGKELTASAQTNLKRLISQGKAEFLFIKEEEDIPEIPGNVLVIDALFGSGLTRPLDGLAAALVIAINRSCSRVIAIDLPSGLMGEDNRTNIDEHIIKANLTLSFQFPKLAFLLPENEKYVSDWRILPIGLHQDAISENETEYHFIDQEFIHDRIARRKCFSHKGHFGHALLVAGSYGKMGAAVLAAKACLRSGVGLLTVHLPHNTYHILQTAVPESMASIDDSDLMFTSVDRPEQYSAIGIGPAIGMKVNTQRGFKALLEKGCSPMVIDADGINILSQNPEWLSLLPHNTILTPHPGEFDRLAGPSPCGYERLEKARGLAANFGLIIVLKGAFTAVVAPDEQVYFNSTGNPGMATAGSGDALTGTILGFLSQGYKPLDAALTGVYVHGLAGDLAADHYGENGLTASDIIDF